MRLDQESIRKAVHELEEGNVIGFPTETVYGLAARIDVPSAIEKIFTTKERPFFDPLIVHVASIEQAQSVTSHWGKAAEALAKKFWPGPLTLILPRASSVNPMITSGLDSVGIRMPRHPYALEILKQCQVPLAAPSANKFGKTSPTKAEHVRQEFQNEQVYVVDGGDCDIGIESTVLLVKENENQKECQIELAILRKGQVVESDIVAALTEQNIKFKFIEKVDKKESPGHMKHHYMPSVPLIICTNPHRDVDSILAEVTLKLAEMPDEIESIKITKPLLGIKSVQVLNLDPDPVIASRMFYHQLRVAAEAGKDAILLYRTNVHLGERWEPLFDRINKAASVLVN